MKPSANKKRIVREENNITLEQWIDLLQDSTVFKASDLSFLQALYHCPEHRAKASELADILGVAGHKIVNLQIGRLGKRIMKRIPDVHVSIRENGKPRYWHILFWGEDADQKGHFIWQLRPELKEAYERVALTEQEETTDIFSADEIPETQAKDLYEGAKKQVIVNAYERNQKARKLCLAKYGYQCSVCDFDFAEFYGAIGIEYIEVHHIKPLREVNAEYKIDPYNDLRPVCPNCHSMLHKAGISIEELKKIVKSTGRNSSTSR